MGFKYAVIGAGRQGIAAAYDMAKFGEAEEVLLVDINKTAVEEGVKLINDLLERKIATPIRADVNDIEKLASVLKGVTSFLSAVPYQFNPNLTQLAIRVGANMCDLGGNTDIVRDQLKSNEEAEKTGISIVPDCGMGPGMNISLATYAMSLIEKPREVYIWDGGLPQNPKPPWNYLLTFNIGGLTNEYHGNAYFLQGGGITPVSCFDGYEELDFPHPIGRLEAFVTSGGLSTMPWTFEGKLERLENRTLRYPGHWAQFKAFSELGLLNTERIEIGDTKIVPRDVFHQLLEPKIIQPEIRDIGIIKVKCIGESKDSDVGATIDLIDYYDEKTGFTAMQRLTGWHASIISILAAQGKIQRGAVPVELAVPGKIVIEEARRRGFQIGESISSLQ